MYSEEGGGGHGPDSRVILGECLTSDEWRVTSDGGQGGRE